MSERETIWVARDVIRTALGLYFSARRARETRQMCGFLLSTTADRNSLIVELIAGTNVHPSPEQAFELSADELRTVSERADDPAQEVAAMWVVHLIEAAAPTHTDIEVLKASTERGGPSLLLVVGTGSGSAPVVRGFRYRHGHVEDVRILT